MSYSMQRFINIYSIYINMRKTQMMKQNKITIIDILGFIEKRVTPFGTGAKVDCPKEYLGKRVYLIICKN